ncbi:MAG: acyltransferase family protein [Ilumatobacteraceae bacterium]|nr:acyltransferase family protein [Ilumatobacteraceae bacterium]
MTDAARSVAALPESARQLAPSATPWAQRPHLDGLRTVAVYLVVAYHAGVSGFDGGFIGVDLFFTLSGYLVTMVLLQDLSNHGRIRLTRFYGRRARRLIPAATVAVIGTSLGALLVLTSFDRSTLTGDATASSLWFANWHFLHESSDYFASEGPESPFIHFWSLAIEEQFYVGFPLVLIVAWRLAPRFASLLATMIVAIVLSVAAQIVLADGDTNRAYLGTDARAYQILAGSALALLFWRHDVRSMVERWRGGAAAVGVVAPVVLTVFVLLATPAIDVDVSTRGLLAAVVAVGSIASLELGRSAATGVLSRPTVRYLGQISYGTYLWHWPVLVLTEALVDMGPVSALVVSGVVGTALAALSAEMLERPVRRPSRLDRAPVVAIALGVSAATVAGLVVAPALLEADRTPTIVARSSSLDGAITDDVVVPDVDWSALAVAVPDVPTCERLDGSDCFVAEGSAGTMLLIGDSHARMLLPALEQVAAGRDMSLALDFSQGCPWQFELLGDADGDKSRRCAERRELTYGGRIEMIEPELIVVAGFPASVEGRGAMTTPNPAWQGLDRASLVERATIETLERLEQHGVPVLVIEPFPHLDANPVSCLSAATMASECVIEAHAQGTEEAAERAIAARSDLVRTLDLDSITCPTLPRCVPIVDGIVVRRDPHHLTMEFAATLSGPIAEEIDQMLPGSPSP